MSLRKNELADNEIQLVEQHLINASDPRFLEIDQAAFASKNLWNAANYILRQAFIHEKRIVAWKELYAKIKTTEAYQALPRKVSNQVLIQLQTAWSCFFKALAAWRKEPDKFLGRPKLPNYKHKTEGRNILTYENGAVHKRSLKKGLIDVSSLHLAIPTEHTNVSQVRITPRKGHYVVEVVYIEQISQKNCSLRGSQKERREAFEAISTFLLERFKIKREPEIIANNRELALSNAGLDFSGQIIPFDISDNSLPVTTPEQRLLDTEFIAVYW